MALYEFTAHLDREPTHDEVRALHDAGLDNTFVECTGGHGILHVSRECATVLDAIVSVVADAARAGFRIVGIDDEEYVTLATVAQRLGLDHDSAVAHAVRPALGLPPLTTAEWKLVSWTTAAGWFRIHLGIEPVEGEMLRAATVKAADHYLRALALDVDLGALPLIAGSLVR